MKILISVLLISSFSFLPKNQFTNNTDLQGCNCSSLTCSCQVDGCNDPGGAANSSSCNCSLFSCNCACTAAHIVLPTATEIQNQNSEDSEKYFNDLGVETGTAIADYIGTLRDAIANEDLETYAETAPLLETAFKNLTESEQKDYMTWAIANLTLVND